MASRLRVSHVIVQPVLVVDDGEELTAGPAAQQITLSLADLDGFADRLRADVAALNSGESND